MKNIIMLSFCISLSAFAAEGESEDSKAGLFVEPALTYEIGKTSVNYPAPLSDSTGNVDGFGVGARVGFHLNEAFFVGGDLRFAMPQFEDSAVNYNAKATAMNWAPVVGFQMPDLGLRLWGSYIIGGQLDPEASGSFDVKYLDASGYRVGAGFRLAMVSLNLEYQQLKYGQAELEQIGPFSPGTALSSVNLETKSWLASVSFPFEF